ncbi:phosphonatase-like hydrolase [Conyzicola lurida]|uniref:Phosphonatase-like hydrolase n=1 Tax=Conyzicola lurida TaxID=1172621 RepID=A0A841AH53_9MICO|nr:HAD family hydrolase [Conyzicola lurida]MBB5842547.1 phosphonatase-like hydrolase [Conyzicola lurida]
MTDITLAVLDMAGTTVSDDGVVEQSFADAYDATPVLHGFGTRDAVRAYAKATMGQSKIEVFGELTSSYDDAVVANLAFEKAFADLVASGACTPLPGAVETITRLRDSGIAVVLTTGFSKQTQDALIDSLGWGDLVDLALCPADAGRGRPFPDLNLTALIRSRTLGVQNMLVAGDTSTDMLSATRAGAAYAVGVLSGAHDEELLRANGATDILAGVAGIPALLGLDG